MFFRVTLIAAAIATAAMGAASPAAAQPVCQEGYYYEQDLNECVHRPEAAPTPPPGATAKCADGTYSFSQHPHDDWTCSGHGGAVEYLTN
ncbi:DUF3761 domain-containing protein [Mycobacterium sp. SM1]|uniref:DUF3761 domain-containing protein n=1 Tax=Mycobacterium sp. SM1 TaxID=2816243 RepID=UPI001BCC887A|nr:DUF3761 domain-containing protein [Mycobacterium sp. SM1]MBS4729520.1 DUF3761 domain-containing protein [Mycobacterium sp. SM1]